MATTKRETKNDRIYVRVNEEIKDDFEIVANYRGLSTSALLHSLIVKTIHDERENRPQIFNEKRSAGSSGKPGLIGREDIDSLGLKPVRGSNIKKAKNTKKKTS